MKAATKSNCALALTTRFLMYMVQRRMITIDEAVTVVHDAGDLAEQVGDGDIEARMLMDELLGSLNRLRNRT
jgi:hypothetical protein